MANKTAVYKDQAVIDHIEDWFVERSKRFNTSTLKGTALDLYFDYTSAILNDADMMALSNLPNYSQFIKCLHAAHIVEFAPSMWQYVEAYEPSYNKLIRITP
jgi:hypothetical protein